MSDLFITVLLPEIRVIVISRDLDFISLVALSVTCKRMAEETRPERGRRMAASPPEHMPRISYAPTVYDFYEHGIRHVGYMRDWFSTHEQESIHPLRKGVKKGIQDGVRLGDGDAVAWMMETFKEDWWKGRKGWDFVIEDAIRQGDRPRLRRILVTFAPVKLEREYCLPKHRSSRTNPNQAVCYDMVVKYMMKTREE